MGFQETIRNAAKMAISLVGNIAISSSYFVVSDPTYDPATGTATPNKTGYTGVPVVFDDGAYQALGKIDLPNMIVDQNERLFYIAQADLIPDPNTGDELMVSGVTWQIVDVKTDPAEALWILKGKRA